jgi:hypothetical protein
VTGPGAIDRDGAVAQLAALRADREALADCAMRRVYLVWLALDVRGAMVAAGAVLGVVVALVSRWWSRVFVAELRGQL